MGKEICAIGAICGCAPHSDVECDGMTSPEGKIGSDPFTEVDGSAQDQYFP